MGKQHSLFEIPVRESDIVYTPRDIAAGLVRWLNPSGLCLDPCKGDGAFYDFMPEGSEYCEIREGKDFFEYSKKVNWIIGNPPYSIFEQFMEKSFSIADNVAFLVPTNKVFQRQIIMDRIQKWGGGQERTNIWKWPAIGFSFWVFCWHVSLPKELHRRIKNSNGDESHLQIN